MEIFMILTLDNIPFDEYFLNITMMMITQIQQNDLHLECSAAELIVLVQGINSSQLANLKKKKKKSIFLTYPCHKIYIG